VLSNGGYGSAIKVWYGGFAISPSAICYFEGYNVFCHGACHGHGVLWQFMLLDISFFLCFSFFKNMILGLAPFLNNP